MQRAMPMPDAITKLASLFFESGNSSQIFTSSWAGLVNAGGPRNPRTPVHSYTTFGPPKSVIENVPPIRTHSRCQSACVAEVCAPAGAATAATTTTNAPASHIRLRRPMTPSFPFRGNRVVRVYVEGGGRVQLAQQPGAMGV